MCVKLDDCRICEQIETGHHQLEPPPGGTVAGHEHERQQSWVLSLLDQYEPGLTRYATRLLGDVELARDAVQHTFLKLCDTASEEIGDHEAAWLYTVCRNKALDELRRRVRVQRWEAEAQGQDSKVDDPAQRHEAHDLYEWLRRLVGDLPSAQREVLSLWAEGFSYREIARVTTLSEGNVRVLAHRALKYLREHPAVVRLARSDEPQASTKETGLRIPQEPELPGQAAGPEQGIRPTGIQPTSAAYEEMIHDET